MHAEPARVAERFPHGDREKIPPEDPSGACLARSVTWSKSQEGKSPGPSKARARSLPFNAQEQCRRETTGDVRSHKQTDQATAACSRGPRDDRKSDILSARRQ